MTLGKKIGGGFCVVLLLALIQGIISYRAMDEGADVSEQIAVDRVPRLVHYSALQNDLLLTAYYQRVYYATQDESLLKKVHQYIDEQKTDLKYLRDLNAKHFFENTNNFLNQFEKDAADYEGRIRAGQAMMKNLQQATDAMIKGANASEADMEKLIITMTQTQRGFIEAGNVSAANQYARNIADATAAYSAVSNLLEEMLMAEQHADIEGFARLRATLPEIGKKIEALQGGLLRQECKDLCADAVRTYNSFSAQADKVSVLQQEKAVADREMRTLFERMIDDSIKMMDLTTNNTTSVVNHAQESLNSGTNFVMMLVIACLIIGIIVAIVITRMIVKPLSETQQFAEAVAEGDLNRELGVHTQDETGKLADALRSMVASLKTNITEAQQKSEQAEKATQEAQRATARAEEAARQAESAKRDGMLAAANQLEGMVEIISSASTELSAQIEQSDRGASESAQRLQEAATAMNQMNATVQEVARNAGSASTASADTKHKAEAGEHVVHQVVQSIGEVQQVSMQLKDDMAQLNERAQDINRIMGVISDIADQTNLLALNAAIEAARAGEAGRGFAVVADEVRKLAEKTMTSTLDVSNAIRAIQESTDKSMGAVDNAVMRISEATELANQSGAALEEIVATVEATSDQVQAIAAASEEQSAASEEINRSIIEVNDMSRMTAEAMAEANQAVADLANQAHKLTDLIQEMKRG